MNTQTHLLLGAALFARPLNLSVSAGGILGSLFPDISLFVMWGWSKARGLDERTIWRETYWDPGWQLAGTITNSAPLYALFALGLGLMGRQLRISAPAFGGFAMAFVLAALVHIGTDFPLHHDDARANFWPISDWVFRSPVSYWDPRYHGHVWSGIELVLAGTLILVLWRRFPAARVRALLVLAGTSYAVVAHHWATSF